MAKKGKPKFRLELCEEPAPERGAKTIIHVNQHEIKKNSQDGGDRPVLTIKTYKSNTYARRVRISGPADVVYSPDKPLACGARVWIETRAKVRVID